MSRAKVFLTMIRSAAVILLLVSPCLAAEDAGVTEPNYTTVLPGPSPSVLSVTGTWPPTWVSIHDCDVGWEPVFVVGSANTIVAKCAKELRDPK